MGFPSKVSADVHDALAQVAVVRDGEHLAARLLRVSVHVLPEPLWILTVEGGEGNDLVHAVRAVAEDHGAMEILTAGRRGPLETVQRRENTRMIPLLGRLDSVRPGRCRDFTGVEDRLAALHGDDRFDGGFDTLLRAFPGHLIPALALRIGEESGVAGANLIGDSHVLGVIGDGDPVQRPVLFEALAVVEDDLTAGGDPEEVVGRRRDPEHSGVEGVAGVDVGDAPVDAIGKLLVRIGRIIGLLRFDRRAGSLGRRGSLCHGEGTEAAGRQRQADGRHTRAGCATYSSVLFQGRSLSLLGLLVWFA